MVFFALHPHCSGGESPPIPTGEETDGAGTRDALDAMAKPDFTTIDPILRQSADLA